MQEDFKEYLKEARQKFCKEVNKISVGGNLVLRTEIDSFLIAYDQAVAKAFSLSGVSQQRELLEAFAKQIKEDNELTEEITFQDINKCIASNCG